MKESRSGFDVNRRQFLKASGAAGVAAGGAGLGLFGYAAGKDPSTYLGWQTYEGMNQSFNRSAWAVDTPTYERVGPTSRPDSRVENIFARRSRFMRQYRGGEGLSD
ncbi:MAG: twin-arginine translocation signal domain-containing protein, partial [Candidatus Latescibacteria bacterium]|nr:twin-arginine translocation signal domain-containing protein [Candidatus Latescibacterota bacterium]